MNIIDIGIILFIVLGALIGWRQGFTRSLVNFIGYVVIIIIAFLLKNPISEFFMNYLPFFNFFGMLKGVTILNIALYELIAFLLVFTLLLVGLKFLMFATRIFETILNFTVILGIPSKILGAIIGIVKNYVVAFMILYILTLPMISNTGFLKQSELTKPILEKTPVLSMFADKALEIANEFADLQTKYKDSNHKSFNLEALDLFLKYDVVTPETMHKLIDKGKIKIKGAEAVLAKYEEA